MEVSNIVELKLPELIDIGRNSPAGLDRTKAEILNAILRSHVLTTGIPTLDDEIVDPFRAAAETLALQEAATKGLLEDGTLAEKFEHTIPLLDGEKLVTTVSPPGTSISYEGVLTEFRLLLRHLTGPYIPVHFLLNTATEIKDKPDYKTTRKGKTDVDLRDPADEKIPLDPSVSELTVYLDGRYTIVDPTTAYEFHKARSLRSRFASFVTTVEGRILELHGIGKEPIQGQIRRSYLVDDKSRVRILIYPRFTTQHGETFSRLFNRDGDEISRNNGDLQMLQDLAFKDRYDHGRKGSTLTVTTEVDEEDKNRGTVKILRETRDGSFEGREYAVQRVNREIRVRIRDVTTALSEITQYHTKGDNYLSIRFYPALPTLLFSIR